jgi:hypothetical protein
LPGWPLGKGSAVALSARGARKLRQDGTLINHKADDGRCPGSVLPPADLPAVANWLPLLPGLTEHGQRHAHQVMLDDLNIRYVLQAERMGHEVPGMRGIYTHIAPEWRVDLVGGLQRTWEESLAKRAKISARSAVPLLDGLLSARTVRLSIVLLIASIPADVFFAVVHR